MHMTRLEGITFAQAIEQNTRKMNRLGYAPETAINDITAKKRARFEELLGERGALVKASSREWIKDRYGREYWNADFTMLSDVPEKDRWELWHKIPNCQFKRFQQIFCNPEDFIIPTTAVLKGVRDVHWAATSLKGCLVTPDRIPDQFAEDVHLIAFGEEEGPQERLLKKDFVVPDLMQLWESARPIMPDNPRILVIQPSTAQEKGRYPNVPEHDPAINGTILYTREEKPTMVGRRGPRELQVQHFTSLYAAHRKTIHEEVAYEKEIDTVSEVVVKLSMLNADLDTQWRRGATAETKNALRAKTFGIATECKGLLEGCRNGLKQDALQFIQNLEDGMAEGARPNVTVCMTKMIAAKKRLQDRYAQMKSINSFNMIDRNTLQIQMTTHEKTLKAFRRSVEEGGTRIANYISEKRVMPGTAVAFGIATRHLAPVDIQPLRTYADAMKNQTRLMDMALPHVNTAFRQENEQSVVDTLIRMHVIGKLQAVCTCFGHVERHLIDPKAIPLSKIREFVASLKEILSQRELFPDHQLPYAEEFSELKSTVESIVIDDAPETRETVKELIRKWDVEAMAQRLNAPPQPAPTGPAPLPTAVPVEVPLQG